MRKNMWDYIDNEGYKLFASGYDDPKYFIQRAEKSYKTVKTLRVKTNIPGKKCFVVLVK